MSTHYLTLPAAVIPSILLVVFFWKSDYFPEPPKVVIITFILGIVSIFPLFVIGLPFRLFAKFIENPFLYGAYNAFFCAAIPEELIKFLIIYFYCMKHPAFDEKMDGLVYGATASLGFAAIENVIYVSAFGYRTAIIRAITSLPCHAFFGMTIGYYIAKSKFTSKHAYLYKGLVLAVFLHGLYDLPLLIKKRVIELHYDIDISFFEFSVFSFLFILVCIYAYGVRTIREAKREQKQEVAGKKMTEV